MEQKPLVFELIPGRPSNQAILFFLAVDWLQLKLSSRPNSPPVKESGSVPTAPHILTFRVLFIEVGIDRRPAAIIASHGSIRVVSAAQTRSAVLVSAHDSGRHCEDVNILHSLHRLSRSNLAYTFCLEQHRKTITMDHSALVKGNGPRHVLHLVRDSRAMAPTLLNRECLPYRLHMITRESAVSGGFGGRLKPTAS